MQIKITKVVKKPNSNRIAGYIIISRDGGKDFISKDAAVNMARANNIVNGSLQMWNGSSIIRLDRVIDVGSENEVMGADMIHVLNTFNAPVTVYLVDIIKMEKIRCIYAGRCQSPVDGSLGRRFQIVDSFNNILGEKIVHDAKIAECKTLVMVTEN